MSFATTEHFNLATARASTISETIGRASIFLGSVSAGLVALAFAGQTSRVALYTFGLVLFPVLVVLGTTTFNRTLQTSIDDTVYIQRINRLRRFYLEMAPELADYVMHPAPTDDKATVLGREGFQAGRWQTLLSVPGTIGVINSVLAGVTMGLAAAAVSDDSLWAATLTGVAVFALALVLHQRHQRHARFHSIDPFAENER